MAVRVSYVDLFLLRLPQIFTISAQRLSSKPDAPIGLAPLKIIGSVRLQPDRDH